MYRHRTDWFSLVVGVAALTGGGGYLVARATDVQLTGAQIVSLLLLGAGLLGVAAAVALLVGHREAQDQPEHDGPGEAAADPAAEALRGE